MVAFDPDIERAVLLYNVISGMVFTTNYFCDIETFYQILSGPIFFASASGVFLLMWFDKDRRNVVYRRLIMGLQVR